jgi:hypothetical protein
MTDPRDWMGMAMDTVEIGLRLWQIKVIRKAAWLALLDANKESRDYTPLYWTGSHLHPIPLGVIRMVSKKKG